MVSQLHRTAYGVLFPVLTDITPSEAILRFLDGGGKALLFGEHADEYATGEMRPSRIALETADAWRSMLEGLRERSGVLLAAVDADISAVNRLHVLTPPLPTLSEAQGMEPDELEAIVAAYGRAARELGVNMVLSPTADVVTGPNEWLRGRTLGGDVATVERLVRAYVRGAGSSGMQTALKHFPGHPSVTGQPSSTEARVSGSLDDLRPTMAPFAAGILAGAEAVMMGPAIFEGVDPPVAASISPTLIRLLRSEFAFRGLVITCDLDHRATQRDASIEDTAVAALRAGADLLLLSPASIPAIPAIAGAIASAVDAGQLDAARLEAAAAATLAAASG